MKQLKSEVQTALDMGLSEKEFERIIGILGRAPNQIELIVFSEMWSEESSYKSASQWLKTLPLKGINEPYFYKKNNSNLVKIEDQIVSLFKLTSRDLSKKSVKEFYNLLPLQFCELAIPPLAVMNTFQRGQEQEISHVPYEEKASVLTNRPFDFAPVTVNGGYFESKSHLSNSILTQLFFGISKKQELVDNMKIGSGDLIILLGENSKNELDLTETRENIQKRTFDLVERLLKEGITNAISLVGKEGVFLPITEGILHHGLGCQLRIDDLIGADPFKFKEKLRHNTSGKVLIFIAKQNLELLLQTVEEFELDAKIFGKTTESERIEFLLEDKVLSEISPEILIRGGGAPVYEQKYDKPDYLRKVSKQRYSLRNLKSLDDIVEAAKTLFASPNIMLYPWSEVGKEDLEAKFLPIFSDVLRLSIPEYDKKVFLSMAIQPGYTYADPYQGIMLTLAEGIRAIAVAGGQTVAINCSINVGAPGNPKDYWQFVQVVKGITDFCKKFELTLNECEVNFNNALLKEEEGKKISIPIISFGSLGILKDEEREVTLSFKEEGDLIYMLGNGYNELHSSQFFKEVYNEEGGGVPFFDLHEEYELQKNIRKLINKELIQSAHQICRGGLFIALLNCAMAAQKGIKIESVETFRREAFLFGESGSRVLISISLEDENELQNYLISNNVSFIKLGEVFGNELIIDDQNYGTVKEWTELYQKKTAKYLNG